jgi:hypothetical protein
MTSTGGLVPPDCASLLHLLTTGYGTTRKRSDAQVNSAYRGAAESRLLAGTDKVIE